MTAIMTAKKKVVGSTIRPAKVAVKKVTKLSAPRLVRPATVLKATPAVKAAKPARMPMKPLAAGRRAHADLHRRHHHAAEVHEKEQSGAHSRLKFLRGGMPLRAEFFWRLRA